MPPPVFFSFGIPPANMPPNCGAESVIDEDPPPIDPWSLLLRARLAAGAVGGLKPGTGGAPPTGGAAEEEGDLSSIGADRSLTWTFLSRAPDCMSPRSAPCALSSCQPVVPANLSFHLQSSINLRAYE